MQKTLPQFSDAEIVCRVLHGEAEAFASLITRVGDTVLRIVKRHVPPQDVEETVQEVFVRTYQSLRTFREGGLFRQWVSSIALRACYDYWRKAYRSREIPLSSLGERHEEWLEDVLAGQSQESPTEKESREEAAEVLNLALGRLSAGDRMVLELVYLEGLSLREAAALLGWSVTNVKVRSFRSRRKLEEVLRRILAQKERVP